MKTKKSSIDKLSVKHFWQVGLSLRKEFLLSWLIPVGAIGMGIGVPYYVGRILGALSTPGSNMSHDVYGLIAVSIVGILGNRIGFNNFLTWQPKIMAKLQTEAMAALLKRGTSFHNNRVSGKLVSDALDYPSGFSQLSTAFFSNILPFSVVIVSGITLVMINSFLIGLVVLVMSVLAVGSGVYFRYHMAPFRKIRLAATKAVTAHLADTIVNNQTVKSFGQEKHELESHEKLNNNLLDSRLHDWKALAKDGSNRIIGLLTFEIIFVFVVIHLVRQDPSLLATGIFAFSYTVTLTNRLFDIGTMLRAVEEALLLCAPITEMLQESPEIIDTPHAKDLKVSAGRLLFDHVNFMYHDSSAPTTVFKELNLTIEPGEKVGLVGPSGGGKSTLTKILLRFEELQHGKILIDGQDIAEVTQVSLRQAIAYVAQEPLLFHRSIRNNISYGNQHATTEQIREVSQKAYALGFIEALPSGFDTIVGERGIKLSGGQRQRIAIARAMLKNAPILVLDEATSALDSESEKVIQDALVELMKGRTTIVIAHRLSTIQRLDRILVLDNGEIVEQGSHKELVGQNGTYARLWAHQSGGFIEE